MKFLPLISRVTVFGFVLALTIVVARAQPATVSVLAPGTSPASAGGDSISPVISRDGRYVLFSSSANNLATNAGGMAFIPVSPAVMNVYRYDRTNGTTTLVSINTTGSGGANADCCPVAISTNGQFALFESAASNLFPGDTNAVNDVFVRDVVNGLTTLASVSTNGAVGNGVSRNSTMTPDGRYVAFVSSASNLVPGDTNGIADIFVRDLQGGNTVLASVGAVNPGPTGLWPTNSSEAPDISDDGRYVAFFSTATNLVSGVATTSEIYVRDLLGGVTFWASTNSRSIIQSLFNTTNVVSCSHVMSSNGLYVAYVACATNLTAWLPSGVLLRYNVLIGATDIVNTNVQGTEAGFDMNSRSIDMTPDGNYIAFITNSLVPSGKYLPDAVWVWNAPSNTTILVSEDANSVSSVAPDYYWPQLSDDGHYVTFFSSLTNLAAGLTVTGFNLYVYDSVTTNISLVDPRTNGSAPAYCPASPPSLSSNGQFIAFDSFDPALVANDGNRAYDVFVRDLSTNAVELISAISPALPSLTPNGSSLISAYSVSTNARYVAFTSEAENLVNNDTNLCRDVFVHDMLTGSNVLASVATNGFSGNGISSDCSISGDGNSVAFTSSSSNLVAGDTNNCRDVFLRNISAGTTTLVSVNTSSNGPGNADSYSPILSPDGRYVVFRSKASNLALGITSTNSENLYCRDTLLGTTFALVTNTASATLVVAMSPDGHYVAYGGSGLTTYVWNLQTSQRIYTNSASVTALALSLGAANVAYATSTQVFTVNIAANTNALLGGAGLTSHPGLQFSTNGQYLVFTSGGSGKTNQVVFFNTQTGLTYAVSEAYSSSSGGNGSSDSPAISPDGHFIAYRSVATNLVPGVGTGVAQLYLFDRFSGDTTLISSSAYGNYAADSRSMIPVFSADSQTLLLTSWASDLGSQDFNQAGDVFAFSLYNSTSVPALTISIIPPATISWPAVAGKTYQVQFKNNLTDPYWQLLNGNVSIVGDQGYAIDFAPAVTQRFYRVMAQ